MGVEKTKKKEYYDERDKKILDDYNSGLPWIEIANKYNITKDAVRHVLLKLGVYVADRSEKSSSKKEAVIKLRLEGRSYTEITSIIGHKTPTWVHSICKQAGLDKKWAFEQFAIPMREDRKNGMSFEEIAKKHNVSTSTVAKACKDVLEPERVKSLRTKGVRLATQRQHELSVEKYFAYLALHGFVKAKQEGDYYIAECKDCGNDFKVSCSTLRHYYNGTINDINLKCKYCTTLSKKISKQENKLISNFRTKDEQILKLLSQKAKVAKREMLCHPCPVCGEVTSRKKYCSDKCSRKAANRAKDNRRRGIIKPVLIDRDINLERLYERDNGRCHICGEQCDWEDYKWVNGAFVVGENYPSVDHVIPLSKGGKHSWANVKLAHHHCNTVKSNRLLA